jgi:hypothetical protein
MNFKVALTRTASRLLQVPAIWAIVNSTVIRLADYLAFARQHPQIVRNLRDAHDHEQTSLHSLFADRHVASGPFQGMIYPNFESCGSQIAPKLIGSYEYELHGIIEQCIASDYARIIDIGCAEGYYAVGFAIRDRDAHVIAADTSSTARELCAAMATLNGVADRVTTVETIDSRALVSIVADQRCLVLSDCEGYEKELFTAETSRHLVRSDLLIECHDYKDASITPTIISAFHDSHVITKIYSQDEFFRPHQYADERTGSLPFAERRALMTEKRGAMIWLFCRPRSDSR